MEVLNKAKKFMVEFANKNGIDLQKEFGTVESFNQFVIAFSMKTMVDSGVKVEVAYDTCFGNGAYNELANRVHEIASK